MDRHVLEKDLSFENGLQRKNEIFSCCLWNAYLKNSYGKIFYSRKETHLKKGFLKLFFRHCLGYLFTIVSCFSIFSAVCLHFSSLCLHLTCLFTFRQVFVYTWTAICFPFSSYLFTFLTAVSLQFIAVCLHLSIFCTFSMPKMRL